MMMTIMNMVMCVFKQDRAVKDASSGDFFIALTLTWPKMSIFIIFHESVTVGPTDGRTYPVIEMRGRI